MTLTSMNEEQWDRRLQSAPLVYKVNIQSLKPLDLYVHSELRQLLVQLSFVFTPVITVLPLPYQPRYVRKWCTVLPLDAVELVRKASVLQLRLQSSYVFVRDGNGVRLHFRHGGHEESWRVGAGEGEGSPWELTVPFQVHARVCELKLVIRYSSRS